MSSRICLILVALIATTVVCIALGDEPDGLFTPQAETKTTTVEQHGGQSYYVTRACGNNSCGAATYERVTTYQSARSGCGGNGGNGRLGFFARGRERRETRRSSRGGCGG